MAKVLLVDDDPALLRLLSTALLRDGHEVAIAHNGSEALTFLATAVVEVLVTDLVMPEQDGLSLLIDLRRLNVRPKVIAMSGSGYVGNTGYLTLARQLGADVTLQKPFELSALIECVAQLTSATAPANEAMVPRGSLR